MARPAGFFSTLEKEKPAAYRERSVEEKLMWLEDILEFSEAALTPGEKAVRERFRRDDFPERGGTVKEET